MERTLSIIFSSLLLILICLVYLLLIKEDCEKFDAFQKGVKSKLITLSYEEYLDTYKKIKKQLKLNKFEICYADSNNTIIKIKDNFYLYQKNSLKILFNQEEELQANLKSIIKNKR